LQTASLALTALIALLTASCGEKKPTRVSPPPPPTISASQTSAPPESTKTSPRTSEPGAPPVAWPQESEQDQDALSFPPGAKALLVETGMASWYGAPYHNRRGSNGEMYNMHAMTAAHRTLPLGSIVRVTNVKTGHSAILRITDRGPFVEKRILDLSYAAAQKVDVWQPGVAEVRIEVMWTPVPLEQGGRWAVQIGGFGEEDVAHTLAGRLSRRYQTAKVACFSSPVGDWWVRIRVLDDDRERAEEVAHDTQTPQGSIFLVRLD
jgi:rare lipoprotein A